MKKRIFALTFLVALSLVCSPLSATEPVGLLPSPAPVVLAPVTFLTPTTVTSTSTDWNGGGTTIKTTTIYPSYTGWTQTESVLVLDGADSTFDWGTTTHVTVSPSWVFTPIVWTVP